MSRCKCRCSDPGCPTHIDYNSCSAPATDVAYRIDHVDIEGTDVCDACYDDMIASGVFTGKDDPDAY